MNTNPSQDRYKKILQEIKEEKMNWDFEDFLAETEKQEKPVALHSSTKGGSFPKLFWMAASFIVLLTLGFLFKDRSESTIIEKDQLVINEILKQKGGFQKDSNLAINTISDSVKVKTDSLVSDSASTVDQVREADIMDQILPRKGRIRKDVRPRYADVSAPAKKAPAPKKPFSEYESNFVIINGHKIENEQEAIDLTKYSFRILSENVSKTVAQTDVLNQFNNDY